MWVYIEWIYHLFRLGMGSLLEESHEIDFTIVALNFSDLRFICYRFFTRHSLLIVLAVGTVESSEVLFAQVHSIAGSGSLTFSQTDIQVERRCTRLNLPNCRRQPTLEPGRHVSREPDKCVASALP
jgi:hypothetical protein